MKKHCSVLVLAVVMAVGLCSWSLLAEEPESVRYGVLYPITGPTAQIGTTEMHAVLLVIDLVNGSYDIDSPGDLFRSEGLPNLGGAKVRPFLGDHEGKPDVGRSEAERLITVEKVHVMQGCFQSAVTSVASEVSERYGIPHLSSNSSSPSLTERGFKYFFRTTPHEKMFTDNMLRFLRELDDLRDDVSIKTIALICEDTLWGQDTADVAKALAPEYGFEIVLDIAYPHEATDVDAEVLRVKRDQPDVVLMASYQTDAVLFQNTFNKYEVNVPIIGNNTGHQSAFFVEAVGSGVNEVLTRNMWAENILEANEIARALHELLVARYGPQEGASDLTMRPIIGTMTMCYAINEAGSTDPEAIQQALANLVIPSDMLPLPWGGVQFDEKHQNIYGQGIISQWQNEKLLAVWPWDIAEAEVLWTPAPWSE